MNGPNMVCKNCGKERGVRLYDPCMEELIDQMNAHRIKTVEHCCGHGCGMKRICIDIKNFEDVCVHNTQTGKTVLWLIWKDE